MFLHVLATFHLDQGVDSLRTEYSTTRSRYCLYFWWAFSFGFFGLISLGHASECAHRVWSFVFISVSPSFSVYMIMYWSKFQLGSWLGFVQHTILSWRKWASWSSFTFQYGLCYKPQLCSHNHHEHSETWHNTSTMLPWSTTTSYSYR